MALAVETVAVKYLDITTEMRIPVAMTVFEPTDIQVIYGKQALRALIYRDYEVDIQPDFSFVLVPLPYLVDSINALILQDPTETNYIIVRRILDYETESTPAAVSYTPFTSKEFERTAMRLQQVNDELQRSVKLSETYAPPYPALTVQAVKEGKPLVWGPNGTILNGEIDFEVYVLEAETARDEAVNAQAITEAARDETITARATAENARNEAVNAQVVTEAVRDVVLNVETNIESEIIAAQAVLQAAKDDVESAQIAAEAAKNEAVGARTAAQTAQGEAENARDEAQTAQGEAQTAQGEAAAAQVAAEVARDETVQVKSDLETQLDQKADKANLISDAYATLNGTKYGSLNGVVNTISIASTNTTNTGAHNQAVGALAGRHLTTGRDNILYGRNAGRDLTEGNYNIFLGAMSGKGSLEGEFNVMIGRNAGEKIQTGSSNVIIGKNASVNIESGEAFVDASHCVYLGAEIKPLVSGIQNEVVIGSNAKGHGSRSVTIGNADKNDKTILTGRVGIGTSDPSEKLHIEGNVKASGELRADGDVYAQGHSILSKVTDFVARLGNNSGDDQFWLGSRQFIPYDPLKIYRIAITARRVAGNGRAWAGFNGANADGTVYFNRNGSNTKDAQHYGALKNTLLNADFATYTAYYSGLGTYEQNAGTLLNPHKMHVNVESIEPMILVNYKNKSGTTELALYTISEVDQNGQLIKEVLKIDLSKIESWNIFIKPRKGIEGVLVRQIDGTIISNNLRLFNIPTSSSGLATGSVWNDRGTLKIA